MEQVNRLPEKLLAVVKKHKYAVIILFIGIGMLLLPDWSREKPVVEESKPTQSMEDSTYVKELEQRMEELLSMIEGAGKVRVMLTLQEGSITEYQTDLQTSTDISGENSRKSEERKTVILSEGSAYDKAAVSGLSYPRFQGALVLSQGGERPGVQLNLVRAVASLTGLSTNQITVVKMK